MKVTVACAQASATIEELEGGVGAIRYRYDLAFCIPPAPYLQEQLPGPLGYLLLLLLLLVSLAPLGAIALGRSQGTKEGQ